MFYIHVRALPVETVNKRTNVFMELPVADVRVAGGQRQGACREAELNRGVQENGA